MKKITLFVLLCAVCTLAGCMKLYEHEGTSPIPPIEILEANQTVTLPNVMEEGGVGFGSTLQTTFTANDGWSIDPANVPSWLEVSPMSGDKGEVTLNFSVKQENATWDDVAGEITIKPLTGTPATIAVTQQGLSEGTIYVATAGSLAVTGNETSIKIVGKLDATDIATLRGVWSLESINLLGVHLPENTLPEYAFLWCESLKEITLPAGLTSIGNFAFYYCTSLSNITLPEGVTSIGRNAFEECTSLTEITLPAGVTSIGNYAFAYCDKLTEITLPADLTTIGNEAFVGCDLLTTVHAKMENPVGDANSIFWGRKAEIDLKVPTGKKDTYKNGGWGGFQTITEE